MPPRQCMRAVRIAMAQMSYAKWDKFVAALSDDEDAAPAAAAVPAPSVKEVGVGAALTEDGRIQPSMRPGNARGNGLSTNAPPPRAWPITEFTWADDGAAVSVRVPLAPLATGTHTKSTQPVAQRVSASFAQRAFELEVTDEVGCLYRLRVPELAGGCLEPEACHHRVEGAGADAVVVLTLTKAPPASRWAALGAPERPPSRPVVTVTDYRWSDEKAGVRVWLRVPGVHKALRTAVRVRFRELSFDVAVADVGGVDYQFAVTELPMEVVVPECAWVVEEDTVKVYLRKWARTGWHKLQLHR